jgi:hypothetical protein
VDDVHKKIRLLKEVLERCKRLLFTPTAKPEQEPEKEEAVEQSKEAEKEEANEQSKEVKANESIKVDEPVSPQTDDDSHLSHQHPSSEDRSDL